MKEAKCVVCGAEAHLMTGYAFMEDGKKQTRIYYCVGHIEMVGLSIAIPAFQNQKALDLFMEKHPQLYMKNAKGKRIVFLEVV
jgi:hypothetical protein